MFKQGLREVSGHRNHAASAVEQTIRETQAGVGRVTQSPPFSRRPGLAWLRVTGAVTSITLRRRTAAGVWSDITVNGAAARFDVATGSGEILIQCFGPDTDQVANWPARGEILGYDIVTTGNVTVEWVSTELP